MARAGAKATRRTSEQVRRSIVESAASEFETVGYAGATMRSIAARAGSSLSVLHRHFPAKRDLLSAAALDPFLRFFDEFAATWRDQVDAPLSQEQLLGALIRDLFQELRGHRRSLVSLLAVGDAEGADLMAELRTSLIPVFSDLRAIGERESAARKTFPPDAAHEGIWLAVSLVVGLTLTESFLPGRPAHIGEGDDEAAIAAVTRFCLGGILGPPPPAPAGRPARPAHRRTDH